MKKCKGTCATVEKTVISPDDCPEVLEEKVSKLVAALVDAVGIEVFQKAAHQAVSDSCKKFPKRQKPVGDGESTSEDARGIKDFFQELEEYFADYLDNMVEPQDIDDLEDRIGHIEDFLSTRYVSFEPYTTDADDEDDEDD